MAAGNQRKQAQAANKTRVQNVSTEQTVKDAAGILHRIVVTNANAAAQTVTVKDGGTTLGVYEIAADKTETWEFGCRMDTSILITPSHANIDALIVWD